MKTVLILVAALTLAGCQTTKPVTAEIPIAVACKTADPNQPTYRYNPPYTTVFDGTRDLLGDRDQALAYEIQLRAALASCK